MRETFELGSCISLLYALAASEAVAFHFSIGVGNRSTEHLDLDITEVGHGVYASHYLR